MYDFTLEKTKAGWKAKTHIDLGPATDSNGKEGRRTLHIVTDKYNTTLETEAYTTFDRGGFQTRSFDIGGGGGMKPRDFQKYLKRQPGRATEKTIREMQQTALAYHANQIVAEAKAFYGITDEEGAIVQA